MPNRCSQAARRMLFLATAHSVIALASGAAIAAEKGASSRQEWNLIGGNEYEQHFSELRQINTNTVGKLKLKWFADIPTRDALTGVPSMSDGVAYQGGGLGKANGMPFFADAILEEDIPALKAYIIDEAWRAYWAQPTAKSRR